MDSLDIQVVDSLTVNLNQKDYSTEGQVLNGINVYVEDEQLLFEAALTQDSINLYTRETPDIINIKEITDGISKLESLILKTSKEATLLAKVAELKEALNSIDFTAIEQAIQGVEDITAKEATLIQGVEDIIKAVENIDFTDLENSIAEVKKAVTNIDFSAIAKENTLLVESKAIKDKIDAIEIPVTDLTEVAKENTLVQGIASISQKVDNIVIPEIDTTPLAKEDTLTQGVNTISQKIDDIHMPELDKSDLAKEATLSSGISTLSNKIDNIDLSSVENKVDEGVETLSNKIDNIDLSAVENKVQEESTAIQNKIDNIKLPEIDTTELAKQGENQEATNSAILSALNGVAASMYKGVPIVSQTGDATISPNMLNIWNEVTSLNITKGNDIDGITNVYLIRFVAGENLQVSFIGFNLSWYGGSVPTWKAGSTYEINIVDNLALWAEFTPA